MMLVLPGCPSTLVLNPAFVNNATGEIFPLTPGDRASFVFVRVNNTTDFPIEFLVTTERRVPSEDDPMETVIVTDSVRLQTQGTSLANDLGVLVDCPVVRVGLGEDLDRPTTEPGLFIGAQTAGFFGVGVPPNINPLDSDFGNFDCGDTIVFQASEAGNQVGGVTVRAFVLNDDEQASDPVGPDTFVNTRSLLETEEAEQE